MLCGAAKKKKASMGGVRRGRLVLLNHCMVPQSGSEHRIWNLSLSNPLQVPGRQYRLVFHEASHWLLLQLFSNSHFRKQLCSSCYSQSGGPGHTRGGACLPRCWLGFFPDTHINSFGFHSSGRCYNDENIEKGIIAQSHKQQWQNQSSDEGSQDSRTLRPAVFSVQFYSSCNKGKPFCSFCCNKVKPHICPLTYACIEFFFKLG